MSTKTSIDILLDARQTLVEDGWTKGAFARDSAGGAVAVESRRADSFDLVGAIYRAAGGADASHEALLVFKECIVGSLNDWQDECSFAQVIACLDESVSTLRSRWDDLDLGDAC